MNIGIFDLFLVSIVGISSLFGLYKGILRIILGAIFLFATIFSSYLAFPFVFSILSSYIKNDIINKLSSAVASYVFFAIIYGIVSRKINKIVEPISGGMLDRFLGLTFGVIRGLIVSSFFLLLASIVTTSSYLKSENVDQLLEVKNDDLPEWISSSYTYSYFGMYKKIRQFIPDNILLKDVSFLNQNNANEKTSSQMKNIIVQDFKSHISNSDENSDLDIEQEIEDILGQSKPKN